jgi:hypothetical protein
MAKVTIIDNTSQHTGLRIYQNSVSQSNNMMEMNTHSTSGFNFQQFCNGVDDWLAGGQAACAGSGKSIVYNVDSGGNLTAGSYTSTSTNPTQWSGKEWTGTSVTVPTSPAMDFSLGVDVNGAFKCQLSIAKGGGSCLLSGGGGSSAPTVSSNAGTGSVTHGNDNTGIIAVGTASTASTLTFNVGWKNWASCTVSASTSTALPYVSAISKSAVTFTYVTTGTPTLYYQCGGQ